MTSVKDIPVVQDGAPPGGYPSIRYARQIPNTGPSGLALFSVLGLFMGYGWYKIIQNNYQRNEDAREKREARTAIASLLQVTEGNDDVCVESKLGWVLREWLATSIEEEYGMCRLKEMPVM